MKTLSLCVITGNAESHIERFLDAFQPVADEICIIRACGNQKPDRTLEIAAARGCRTDQYRNSKANDWPHVDDFAAARNKACDMATGDWLMWADTDDVITPEDVKQIRRLIEDIDGKETDGVLMRYVVPEDGVINWRERIWRKGTARWENPIHECLHFNKDARPSIRFDGAEIVHASEKRHASRDERNLRILETIPEGKRTVSQKFHVFQSLIALDRNADAIPKAIEFIGLPDVGKNERYEAFFQLARLAGSESDKQAMLIQALATDPTRREAYGELGLACLPTDSAASLGYTEAMMGLAMPQDAPWNLRRAYYGKLGVSLRAMALRANSRKEEADALEQNHFIRHGAKISLIHATRGRPAMAWKARAEWLRTADNPDAIEHIFGIDTDDMDSVLLTTVNHTLSHPHTGPVGAWNDAARASSGQVLVQLSDDWEPFQGWDTAIISAIGETSKPAVLAVSDGHRTDDLLCMAIMTRERYRDQGGVMFHPEFFSMFSDNLFSASAFNDGVVIDARDKITFRHLHPVFGQGEMDATYVRSNQPYNYTAGEGIMRRLTEGVRVSSEIHGWFDYRDFYDEVAKKAKDGDVIVEVGSWKGASAVYLCQRLQDLGTKADVHCIDTFTGDKDCGEGDIHAEFQDNIAKAGVHVTEHVGDSAAGAADFEDGSVSVVFLDAAHDHASVVKDIKAWLPKLKPGGIFAGHDADSPDVIRALEDCGITAERMGRVWIR